MNIKYTKEKLNEVAREGIANSVDHPLVLVFTADWVSSSTIVEVICEKIIKEREDVTLLQIDADLNKDFFAKYRIKKVPSCIVISNQEIAGRIEGTFSKKDVFSILESAD